jgi:hypothetical protein
MPFPDQSEAEFFSTLLGGPIQRQLFVFRL